MASSRNLLPSRHWPFALGVQPAGDSAGVVTVAVAASVAPPAAFCARRREVELVAGDRPVTTALVACGLAAWTSRNGPPSWESWIWKAAVWLALSCQERLTSVAEVTVAVRLLGAAGTAGGCTTSR